MGPAWGQPAREHAHSLACSPRLTHTHTLQSLVCVCVFWEGGSDLTSSDGDIVQNHCKIFSNMPLLHLLWMHV